MQPFELLSDPHQNAIRQFHGLQAGMWTAMPGIIQSFNPAQQTCTVQPSIMAVVFDRNGVPTNVQLPLLTDVLVIFPKGGGCTMTFPVQSGDECLITFASRCIDAWWFSGGIQAQAELRMHDLSDGFAQVGVSSLPNVISNISTTAAQLRSNDGLAYVGITPSTHEIDVNTTGTINITSAVAVNVTAPAINLGASGQALTGLVTSALETLFNGHTHTSEAAGTATSAPNQLMSASQITTTIKGG